MNKTMNKHGNRAAEHRRLSTRSRRRGAAVVEAALLTPLLVVVTLGAIDIGQFINVSQTLSNASRIGTRRACRNDATYVANVKNAVREYIAEAFPQLDSDDLKSAIQVSVHRADGTPVNKFLTTVPSNEQLMVRVTMDFSAVRWMGAIDFWTLELPTVECYGCRE